MIIAVSNLNKYTARFIIKLNELKLSSDRLFQVLLRDFNEDVRWIIHHQIGLSLLKT